MGGGVRKKRRCPPTGRGGDLGLQPILFSTTVACKNATPLTHWKNKWNYVIRCFGVFLALPFFQQPAGSLVVPRLFLGARRGRVFPGPRVVRAPSIAAVNLGFLVGPRREPQRAGVAERQRGHCVVALRQPIVAR